MNRSQMEQKISKKAAKRKGRDDALLANMAKQQDDFAKRDHASGGSAASTFIAKARYSARHYCINIPKLPALNADLQPGCSIEVTIRRIP